MAFISGRPVVLHHTTVVSRWLVMPRPSTDTSPHAAVAFCSASAMHSLARASTSTGSCSTHLGARRQAGADTARARDAPCLWHVLRVLHLVYRDRPQRGRLVHDGSRRRRSLVERADERHPPALHLARAQEGGTCGASNNRTRLHSKKGPSLPRCDTRSAYLRSSKRVLAACASSSFFTVMPAESRLLTTKAASANGSALPVDV